MIFKVKVLRLDGGIHDETHHPFPSHVILQSTLPSVHFTPHHPHPPTHPQPDTTRSCTINSMCIHEKYTTDDTPRPEKLKASNTTGHRSHKCCGSERYWGEIVPSPLSKMNKATEEKGTEKEHNYIKHHFRRRRKGFPDLMNETNTTHNDIPTGKVSLAHLRKRTLLPRSQISQRNACPKITRRSNHHISSEWPRKFDKRKSIPSTR